MLRLLHTTFEVKLMNVLKAETHTPGFLKKNPHDKVSVLELDDGARLSESNVTLLHFSEGSSYFPQPSTLEHATVQQTVVATRPSAGM
mmetsp:Transcript_18041/g.26796  ORF Transcript_18041/g.26796 Transcript_18041/m.26796 type:complete len:88 (-) Transcript_18041:1548-1811(-)